MSAARNATTQASQPSAMPDRFSNTTSRPANTNDTAKVAPMVSVPAIHAPSSTPAPPGSEIARYQEEARVATEQARRLQELLDDPNKLEQYFAERAAKEFDQAPVHALKLEGVPVKVSSQAPIKGVEFADFLCPTCRNIAGAFDNYIPTTGGRVAVYFKNYPLEKECNPHVSQTVHPGACGLALAGLCANEQGKFWPYHDRVYANPLVNPGLADIQRIAMEAGLDTAALDACLKSSRPRDALLSQLAEAQTGGVSGTPTLFVNGKRLPRLNDDARCREVFRLGDRIQLASLPCVEQQWRRLGRLRPLLG